MKDKVNYLYTNQLQFFFSSELLTSLTVVLSVLTVVYLDLHASPGWVWTGVEFGI